MSARAVLAAAFVAVVITARGARADHGGTSHARQDRFAPTIVERTAVRFVAPETGGPARPRFLSERELAFATRIEGELEHVERPATGEYPEGLVRAAVERHVARAMLAGLLSQGGEAVPELPERVREARAELEQRLGGPQRLTSLAAEEGLSDGEVDAYLRQAVDALVSLDRSVTPVLRPSEAQLREAFRTAIHPFRGARFEDVRARFARWLAHERLRALEIEYFQRARSRVRITYG